ncbi:MAG TPA: hypothetical protein VFP89_03265 [Propionibacteriaceae bacterium]|nr:hypothetical protein [Propionibacteriaceae bacterium]
MTHFDSEEQRRPLFRALIGRGRLPTGFATDDAFGLLYRGTDFIEAVSEEDGKCAYRVARSENGEVVETQLETRRLPG